MQLDILPGLLLLRRSVLQLATGRRRQHTQRNSRMNGMIL